MYSILAPYGWELVDNQKQMEEIQNYLEYKTKKGEYLKHGELLYKIRENKLYQPKWDRFIDFLKDMNVSQGDASKKISIYKRFILDYGFTEQELLEAGGYSKLYLIYKMYGDKDSSRKALFGAKIISRDELNNKMKQNNCQHQFETVSRCKNCGQVI